MTRHEAEVLCKKKVTRKLIEELFTAPPPPGRPPSVRLKPSRCVWCGAHLPLAIRSAWVPHWPKVPQPLRDCWDRL